MADLIDLKEAERLTGIPAPSLRKRLNAGTLAGVKVIEGRREVWRLTAEALESLRSDTPPSTPRIIDQWLASLASGYLTGKPVGHHTVESYRTGMKRFFQKLGTAEDIHLVTLDNVRQVLSSFPVDYEQRKCHYAVRRNIYDAVCSLMLHLMAIGLRTKMDRSAIQELRPKRVFPPRRTSLTKEDFNRFMAQVTKLHGHLELDVALMTTVVYLMVYAGLRRAEVLDLEVGHLRLNDSELWVIDGKGHKDRLVGLPPVLVEQLRQWLKVRPETHRKELLITADGDPLTPTALQKRLERIRNSIKHDKRDPRDIDITLHGLRRTCATWMTDANVPLVHVQLNFGHSDITTTRSYVRTDAKTAADSFKRFGLSSRHESLDNSTDKQSLTVAPDLLDYATSAQQKNTPPA